MKRLRMSAASALLLVAAALIVARSAAEDPAVMSAGVVTASPPAAAPEQPAAADAPAAPPSPSPELVAAAATDVAAAAPLAAPAGPSGASDDGVAVPTVIAMTASQLRRQRAQGLAPAAVRKPRYYKCYFRNLAQLFYTPGWKSDANLVKMPEVGYNRKICQAPKTRWYTNEAWKFIPHCEPVGSGSPPTWCLVKNTDCVTKAYLRTEYTAKTAYTLCVNLAMQPVY